jgi:hypothetical protein
VLPTLLQHQLHCATNTAATSTALCYQHCNIINCIVLPTLQHHQLHCATYTAASSTALCYQHCNIINCIVLPTLLHPHQLQQQLSHSANINIVLLESWTL